MLGMSYTEFCHYSPTNHHHNGNLELSRYVLLRKDFALNLWSEIYYFCDKCTTYVLMTFDDLYLLIGKLD